MTQDNSPQSRPRNSAGGELTYEVGYGKPPKNTRFKPGQSGNAKGRPRGQRNLRTVLNEVLKERIPVREGERTRMVSRLDALVRVTINNALKGDLKAVAAFIQLARPAGLMDEEPVVRSQEVVSADDDAILAEFLERHGIAEQEDGRGQVPPAEAKSTNPQTGAKSSSEAKAEDDK